MAEGPKSTKKDKATDPKATSSGTAAKSTRGPKGPVEDAEVVSETPAKGRKTSGSTSKSSASAPSKDSKPAASSARSTSTSTAKVASTTAAAEPSAEKPAEKPTEKPTDKSADTPAEKPSDKPAEKPTAMSGPADTPKPAAAAKPAETPARRGAGGFLGLLLGGVAAAVIGFVAARTVVPEGWPFPGVAPEVDPLVAVVEAQDAEIAAQAERLSALDAALEEMRSDTSALDELRDGVAARLDGVETGTVEIADRLDAMETRLSSVEKLAPEGTAAAEMAAEAYAKELAALREMFQGELDEIDAAQAEASALEAQLAENAKAASGRAALTQVDAALDTGAPFEDALAELTTATGVDAPDALSAVAAEGVPTLAELQSAFPAAARAAIDADIRTGVEEGSLNRMEAFLRSQLGTRSLEPKEGDSADAVLSRAEAALRTGDLDTVLAEIDALPEAAQPAFADWRALTETRAAALAAGRALAEELNAK